jgi:predicted ferric reductase
MRAYTQNNSFRLSILFFIIIPVFVAGMTNNFMERSILKEVLSIVTILAFFQLIGQFFWARTNRLAVKQLTMSRVLKYHKSIGYTFVTIMFFHPLYVVIPRFFEAGVSPVDAFITMTTTMNTGIVLGIIAWCLMLALGITSLIRNKLPLNYKSWRVFHGILAILFLSTAVWHAIDLGRHANLSMSVLFCVLTAGGILHLLKIYFFENKKQNQ